MDLDAIYYWGVVAELAIAFVAFPLLFWITVPYGGRHTSDRWGPTLPARLSWFLMELPAPVFCILGYLLGGRTPEPVSLLMLGAFLLHYLNRTIVYPLRMRSNGKRTPALSALAALLVNVLNGTIQGLALGHVGHYGATWLGNPLFWIGSAIFVCGAGVNHHADSILRNLREPGEVGYRIPNGGFYRWIASPNYFGEIVQWGGWAIATASGAGLAFFLLTLANLVPRARSNLQWYRSAFPDHPPERRALIPGIW